MPLFATFLLGIAAGLRSMAAPAAAVRAARSRKAALASNSGSTSSSTKSAGKLDASTVFALLALAEMVADRLPFMPDRKSPLAVAWRVIEKRPLVHFRSISAAGPVDRPGTEHPQRAWIPMNATAPIPIQPRSIRKIARHHPHATERRRDES
jgi:hypothetical protein